MVTTKSPPSHKPQSTQCLTVIVRAQNLDSKIFDDCQNWEKQVMMGG